MAKMISRKTHRQQRADLVLYDSKKNFKKNHKRPTRSVFPYYRIEEGGEILIMCLDTFVAPIAATPPTPWERLQILLLGFQISLTHLRTLDGPNEVIACISSNTIKFARLIKLFAFFCSIKLIIAHSLKHIWIILGVIFWHLIHHTLLHSALHILLW